MTAHETQDQIQYETHATKFAQYKEVREGNRVEWTDGRNRCSVTGLPTWTNEYRIAYLNHMGERIFDKNQGLLIIKIDMRLLKLFNDKYGEETANKALVQFTEALLNKLDELIGSNDPSQDDSEYYLYKLRDGGDDYELEVSGSNVLLNRVMQKLPEFLDHEVGEFSDIDKHGKLVTTPLGAECGMSVIGAGVDPRLTLASFQDKYKYDRERRRDPYKVRGLDLYHDIHETYEHAAYAELTVSKYLQIFTELNQSDSEIRETIQPAKDILVKLLPEHMEDLIVSELAPPPDQFTSLDAIRNKVQSLRQVLLISPLNRIKPSTEARGVQPTEEAIEEANEYKSQLAQDFRESIEPAFTLLPKIFGERRKSMAGEYYTTMLVRMCQDLISRFQFNQPLTPKQLCFLGAMQYDTTILVSTYVVDLIKQYRKLKDEEVRKKGLPQINRPLPADFRELIVFSQQ